MREESTRDERAEQGALAISRTMASPFPCASDLGAVELRTFEAMAIAFDEICRDARIPFAAHSVRGIIARRIMDVAMRGARDPAAIKARLFERRVRAGIPVP
jgi:hypothetical protein